MSKKIALSWLLIFFVGIFIYPVYADDTSADGNKISLEINWIDDTPEDRPESMTIELIRTVDDEVTPMDSKTLTKVEFSDKNTWSTIFSFVYGSVWEYSFKITQVIPETALYNYQFIESGNGTNQYTFDYIYGQGTTEMTILTHWDEGIENIPESITLDLFNFTDKNNPERTILLKGEGNSWSARVSGLEYNPDNYYLVARDLPGEFSSVITKGDSSDVYINTISPKSLGTASSEAPRLTGAARMMAKIIPREKEVINGILGNLFFNLGLLILIGLVSYLAVLKHRSLVKKRRKR